MENIVDLPAAAACAAAATGPAIWSSPKTAANCSSPSALIPMSTIPTLIPRKSTAPTSSSSRPMGKFSRSTPAASATAWAKPSIPSPASYGAPPTSATPSATTSFPTTSPTSRRAASTAGPCYYMGANGGVWDPRHEGKHPELKSKVITPDVLVNPHMASLEMLFYQGSQFPAEYKGDGFAAEHGSWNRAQRTGYEVIRSAHERRPRHRRVRGLSHRLHRGPRRRRCLGPARGRRRRATTVRCLCPTMVAVHLARDLRGNQVSRASDIFGCETL